MINKKTLTLLSLALIFGAGTTLAATMNFSDVSEDDWFAGAVDYISGNEIMTGYDDGRFGPGDDVNRAQLATVLERVGIDKVEGMYWELVAIRKAEVKKLKDSSWAEYKEAANRFPADAIPYKDEGLASYEDIKDKLEVLATDSESWSLLKNPSSNGVFYIQLDSAFSGINTYGPFIDDADRIKAEIETENTPSE